MTVRGLRGRPIPGVRECARCRHEVDPTAEATTRTAACPECGADLAAPRGIRDRRTRSRTLAVAGEWLFASALAGAGLGLWPILSKANPWTSLPTAVLSLVLAHGTQPLADKAATEFATRLAAGDLSDAQTRSLAALITEQLEDPDHAWSPARDPLAATLRARGHLADAAWGAFFERLVSLELDAPAKVRPESTISYGLSRTTRPMQLGQVWPPIGSIRLSLVAVRIAGVEIGGDRRTGMIERSDLDVGTGSMHTQLLLPQLPLGESTIEADFACDILDGDLSSDTVLLSKTLRLSKPVTIVGQGEPILEVVRDERLGDGFRAAIALRGAKAHPHRNKGCMVDLSFDIGQTPADAAFEVLLRARDGGATRREHAFLALKLSRATSLRLRSLTAFVEGFELGRYDIILRPSVRLAEESVGFTSAWDGPDIVIEDVEFSEPEAPAPMLP